VTDPTPGHDDEILPEAGDTLHVITCVHPTERAEPHKRIRAVGGVGEDGKAWKLRQHRAVKGVLEGEYRFAVRHQGELVEVHVRQGHGGFEYLAATIDGLHPTTLLALDECP
jgi:hypothetical protein